MAEQVECNGCKERIALPLPEGWRCFMPRGGKNEENRRVYMCQTCLAKKGE